MTIIVDTREKSHIIKNISLLRPQKIKHHSSKLIVADYMAFENPKLYIDRKHNLSEVQTTNQRLPGGFANEVRLAKELGIHLVVLIEQGGQIHNKSKDVANWPAILCKGKIPYAIYLGGSLMEADTSTYFLTVLISCSATNALQGRRIVRNTEGYNNVCGK